ncbi:hypothetical protein CUR178_05662 [Leishmania enriettii]|uniref:LysM domain-containing protein n=1 Tax=Leishmania enriettii TaxID=5663 RepID=A0A836HAG4_LEIEN|nr:hypothetical protein CUR178_05662 [Leishmania enriettii]
MEGLQRQVELLHAALQPLNLWHSKRRHQQLPDPPDEVLSELQLALARATALAHWATAVQREQTPQPLPRSDGDAESLQSRASAQQQTLRSVAELLKVSVAELRRWNPQLPSALREEEVLPPDTFLKVRPAPSSVSPPRLSSTSASRTRLVVGATGPSEAALSDSASVTRSTSARTQGSDAGHGDGVAARQYNSAAHSSQNSFANRAAGAGVFGSAVGSGVFLHSSEGGASQGRYSAWTVGSGRGASQSPQVPELSMSNSGADAAPPCCAPAPVLMSMSVSPRSPPDGCELIDLREGVKKPSPSPENDATSSGKARRRHAAPKALSPSPPSSSLAPPSPPPGAATSPTAAVAGLEAKPLHDGFPQRGAIGGGSSIASVHGNCMRGHFHFSSSSTAGEVLAAFVVTPKARSSAKGTAASRGASAAVCQDRSQSSPTDGEGDRRGRETRSGGLATVAPAGTAPQAKGGARTLPLPSPTRQSSVSLSAVSPPSSLGDDGGSNSANSRTHAGGEKEGGEPGGAEARRRRRLSPSQQRQQSSTLSPSLATPSDSSCGSLMAKARRPASDAAACEAAVASCNVDSPSGFLTPIQHRGRPGPKHTAGTASSRTGCSDVGRSLLSTPFFSSGSCSGIEAETAETVESTQSDMEDYVEDEEEGTPSMRPPAMLGWQASSPPPNLNCYQQSGSVGACPSTSPLRCVVEPPPNLRQRVGGNKYAGMTASPVVQAAEEKTALAARLPPPPLPSASSHLQPPQQRLQGRGDIDGVVEEAGMAGEGDYDTLEGIAAAYNVTVLTIIEWNPYLKNYRPSEPLPPDLPIVLPMSDADEEGDDETSSSASGVHLQQQQQKAQSSLGNGTPTAHSLSATSGNSPSPLPPL